MKRKEKKKEEIQCMPALLSLYFNGKWGLERRNEHTNRISNSRWWSQSTPAVLDRSSLQRFIFNLNITLCWSIEMLSTGYHQIVCCNANVYILETVAFMCFWEKRILNEDRDIAPPVIEWKMVHCVSEIGIELLQWVHESREMK